MTYTPANGKVNYAYANTMAKRITKIRNQECQLRNIGACPLHLQQSAYKSGKSTETTMHHVNTHIQEEVENRKLHLSFPRY
jgi:hypothetical protein